MSKIIFHNPFKHLKHKLWPKEGPAVKLTIWLRTTKSRESPRFPYMQVACNIPLKSSWWGLQLCLKLHLNQRFSHKVMGPQSHKSPNFRNFGGISRQNDIWVLVPWLGTKYIVRGEGGGFPQVQIVAGLMNLCSPMTRLCTKVL